MIRLSYSREDVRFVMRLTNDKRRFSLYFHVFVDFSCGGSDSAGSVDARQILYEARVQVVLGHLRKVVVAVVGVVSLSSQTNKCTGNLETTHGPSVFRTGLL